MRGVYRFWQTAEMVAGRLSDRAYLAIRYYRRFGHWPKLRRPVSFSERMLAYKLSTRGDKRLPMMSDKSAVKEWVAEQIGPDHVIPTLWVGDTLPPRSERNWPTPYVIKSTHGSAHTIFVQGDEDKHWDEIEAKCAAWLAEDKGYGRRDREWHYAHIKPQIIVEPFIGRAGEAPPDYKFFTFNGKVGMIQLDVSRFTGHRRFVFNRTWTQMPFHFEFLPGDTVPPRPANLDRMLDLAEKVATGFEFLRVDFYDVPEGILFGEATFFPSAGHGRFIPPEADETLGSYWRDER